MKEIFHFPVSSVLILNSIASVFSSDTIISGHVPFSRDIFSKVESYFIRNISKIILLLLDEQSKPTSASAPSLNNIESPFLSDLDM